MIHDEKKKILIALMQINVNNAGNRMTTELANGISASMAEFLNTLVVAEPTTKGENVTAIDSKKVPKE